jgi:hypothetical protein
LYVPTKTWEALVTLKELDEALRAVNAKPFEEMDYPIDLPTKIYTRLLRVLKDAGLLSRRGRRA